MEKIRTIRLWHRKPIREELEEYFEGIIPPWFYYHLETSELLSGSVLGVADLDLIRERSGQCEGFYSENLIWQPLGVKGGLAHYSVYYQVANMIDYCEAMIRNFPHMPMRFHRLFRQIQDRYQLLSLYMELSGKYRNEELFEPLTKTRVEPRGEDETEEVRESLFSPIEIYAPRRETGFTMENLPDLHDQIFYCKLWENNGDMPFQEFYHKLIINVFDKALPFACKSRSIVNILPNMWEEGSGTSEENQQKYKKGVKRKFSAAAPPPSPGSNETEVLGGGGGKRNGKRKNRKNSVVHKTRKIIPSVTYKRNAISNKKNGKFEGAFQITKRLVIASLLGIYDHNNVQADFWVRRKIYKTMYMPAITGRGLADWIRRNGKLIVYILRDYMYYCLENIPSIEDHLKHHYFWELLKSNAFDATDQVRQYHNNSFFNYVNFMDEFAQVDPPAVAENPFAPVPRYRELDKQHNPHHKNEAVWINRGSRISHCETFDGGMEWHSQSAFIINDYNRENLYRAPRVMDIGFVDKVFNIMRTLNDQKYASEEPIINTLVPDHKQKLIAKVVETFKNINLLNSLSFEWLADPSIGLSGETIPKMHAGKKTYEMEESRSKLAPIIEEIHDQNITDYYILYFLFYYTKYYKMIDIYPLPTNIQQKIYETLHGLYETRPGEYLPKGAGIYHYCPNCKQFKTLVCEFSRRNFKARFYSHFQYGLTVDLDTGKFYCSKISSKHNPKINLHAKKGTTLDFLNDITEIQQNKKKIKKKRKEAMNDTCPNVELIAVDMKKHVININDNIYAICPYCGILTRLSMESFTSFGEFYSCGCLEHPPPPSAPPAAPGPLAKCFVCQYPLKNPKYMLVIDDSKVPNTIDKVPICVKDIDRLSWLVSDLSVTNPYIFLSHLEAYVASVQRTRYVDKNAFK